MARGADGWGELAGKIPFSGGIALLDAKAEGEEGYDKQGPLISGSVEDHGGSVS
jgi:hypothetical protein